MAHDKSGTIDPAIGNPGYGNAQERWIWTYADNTIVDNLTTAPRGQASGSFSFTIPSGLISDQYMVYMIRNRTAAGATHRTICGHSAPILVSGASQPNDYVPITGPVNTPLFEIDCTSKGAFTASQNGFVLTRPEPLFRGPYDFGNDGTFNFVRVASSNHHNFFEIDWENTSLPVTEGSQWYSRYMVWMEDSFPYGMRPDNGSVKYPGGMRFVGGTVVSNRTHIQYAKAINRSMFCSDYLQWLGPDDVGFEYNSHPGGLTAAYVGGLYPRRWYCIELGIKLNTTTGGVANKDGGTWLWINGHLVGVADTGIDYAHSINGRVFAPAATIFHGGATHIAAPQGYVRLAKLAWGSQRIGLPPEWRQAA
jgi:hypothetical protein